MKENRQRAILQIIAERPIETQFELIEALEAKGVKSTQATISRDIKELRLVKELTGFGTYRYAPPSTTDAAHADKLKTIFKECVTSYVAAQNLVVVKTLPGLASAAMSAIDKMRIDKLAGTIAGDDTAFIAMMDNESAQSLCQLISENF